METVFVFASFEIYPMNYYNAKNAQMFDLFQIKYKPEMHVLPITFMYCIITDFIDLAIIYYIW